MFKKILSICLAVALCVCLPVVGFGVPTDPAGLSGSDAPGETVYIYLSETDRIAIYRVLFTESGTFKLDGKPVTQTIYHVSPDSNRAAVDRQTNKDADVPWLSDAYQYGIYQNDGNASFTLLEDGVALGGITLGTKSEHILAQMFLGDTVVCATTNPNRIIPVEEVDTTITAGNQSVTLSAVNYIETGKLKVDGKLVDATVYHLPEDHIVTDLVEGDSYIAELGYELIDSDNWGPTGGGIVQKGSPVALGGGTLWEMRFEDETRIFTTLSPTDICIAGGDNPGGGGNSDSSSGSSNSANNEAAIKDVATLLAALSDTKNSLPAGAEKVTTADGKTVTTLPVKLSGSDASVNLDLVNTLGSSKNIALKFSITNNIRDSAEVILPGGFGKITEPGRFGYLMAYQSAAKDEKAMLAMVKGDAKSDTLRIGACYNLPTAASITIKTALPNGSKANIYRYNPDSKKAELIGSATVKDGKLIFATKLMGDLLLTTGKV